MKKTFIFAAMVAANVACATEVGLKLERGYSTQGAEIDFTTLEATVAKAVGPKGLAVEGKFIGSRSELQDNNLAVEANASYNFFPGVYAKGGLGQQFGSQVDSYSYYNYGIGGHYKIKQVTVTGEINRQNGFDSQNPAFTRYKVGANYQVARNNTLGVSYVRRLGDVETAGLEAAYSLQF